MAKTNKYLLFASLILAMPAAFALTGDDLYTKCTKALQVPESEKKQEAITRFLEVGTCAGFVGGVLSGINLVGSMIQQQGGMQQNFICLPKKQHSQLLVKELLAYLDTHESERKLPAQVVIYKAFTKKYACNTKHKK